MTKYSCQIKVNLKCDLNFVSRGKCQKCHLLLYFIPPGTFLLESLDMDEFTELTLTRCQSTHFHLDVFSRALMKAVAHQK